ncbi:SRPBCC family protein [Leifsonia sp. NPDC014704]|uniref:SRPBCC family protein n=1 Tax=Leifsonia sp. NPDC014704 TaxID=3364123 RepID=UPI0036F46E80
MDARTIRALVGTSEDPELILRREYRSTAAEVRDACTAPERLARWFGVVSGDPSGVGSEFTVQLDEVTCARGRVLQCDADALSVSWSVDGEPPSILMAEWTDTANGRAELTLRHRLAGRDDIVTAGSGWDDALSALDGVLSGRSDDGDASAARAGDGGVWRTLAAHPLELARTIDAERSRVWNAIASADGLQTWWWRHWHDVSIVADVRVGGLYRIAAPAAGIVVEGRYLAVEPFERLAFEWRWIDDDGPSADEAVEFRLTDAGAGTRLVVRHTGPWADGSPAESYRQGWEFTLGELTAVLAG